MTGDAPARKAGIELLADISGDGVVNTHDLVGNSLGCAPADPTARCQRWGRPQDSHSGDLAIKGGNQQHSLDNIRRITNVTRRTEAKIRWTGEEAWLKGNLDALDEVYAREYVWHRPPLPDATGLAAVKENMAGMRSAYSEIQIDYWEMIGEGDSIAYRYTWRGKHTGQSPSLPIPPTGKEVSLVGCIVVHIADGKIVEEFEYSDYLGFLQQLGVVPPLG